MARLFIFGIGGTGARVLRSFTMLLAASLDQLRNVDVYPVIIDYDERNGDTDIATNCINNYNAIHQLTWKDRRLAGEDGYFKSNLMHLIRDSFKMVYAPDRNNRYGDYIGWDTLRYDEANSRALNEHIDTTRTKLLLSSLYNTDPISDDAEINLKMDVGFKGNPNIGSVVFHDMDTNTQEFRDFLTMLTDNDKVIVIGSLFGGTGSSGVPEIIRKVKRTRPGVRIGAILAMPYFAPKTKTGGTIRAEIFNSKTKAAINYYKDSGLIKFNAAGAMDGGMINAAYFVGDPIPTILPYCDGGPGQVNPANMVELICAMAMVHFVNGAGGCYKYGVNQFIVGDGVSVKQLFHDDLSDDFSKAIIKRFTSFAIAIKYFMFRTMNADSWSGVFSRKPYYYTRFTIDNPKKEMKQLLEQLQSFWDKMSLWLNEISNKGKNDGDGNSHALSLFSTEANLDILVVKTPAGSPKYKDVDGSTVDGLINEDVRNFKATAGGGTYITSDEEFLLMHGLYTASIKITDKVLR